MAEQVPSVGRIVHFVYGTDHRAALITQILPSHTGEVGLTVFPPGEDSFTTVAPYSAEPAGGTWHWPEYVPAKEDHNAA